MGRKEGGFGVGDQDHGSPHASNGHAKQNGGTCHCLSWLALKGKSLRLALLFYRCHCQKHLSGRLKEQPLILTLQVSMEPTRAPQKEISTKRRLSGCHVNLENDPQKPLKTSARSKEKQTGGLPVPKSILNAFPFWWHDSKGRFSDLPLPVVLLVD